ncbi:unnamed protein product [Effrenium voratum]|uniref:Ion transport domain-containing protein n=1 Tax=Effrenium voratum TaxID=2562239 RepID=A0AA36JLM4_9DINO|nr:unnamed protein product [Effrenium voratum]CAJ1441897.1 unnamed protein product [Effrenium voratum]|mmetsp:Transcript_71667/g.171144  ORF Transcript_71667/g.171144 Transcript_71667/m.171144 type:complete len:1139 (+) Transcript_71667:69-3485(+)
MDSTGSQVDASPAAKRRMSMRFSEGVRKVMPNLPNVQGDRPPSALISEMTPKEHPGIGTQIFEVVSEAVKDDYHKRTGRGWNYDLWRAAKMGNADQVKRALQEGAEHTYEVQADDLDEEALEYKMRKVSSKAIHAAALCKKRSDAGEEKAYECVKFLAEKKADVSSKALICDGGGIRELEAIHMAAGHGNARTVELLILHRADPNAQATVDGKAHYAPIHDAVWFNQRDCVETLLHNRADVFAKNNDGNTALHLAAMLGHARLVWFLLYGRREKGEKSVLKGKDEAVKESAMKESLQLVKRKNNKNKDPLTMAVERGHFPAKKLHLFTSCLEEDTGRVQAFLRVAMTCPDAAPKLVRTAPRLEDVESLEDLCEDEPGFNMLEAKNTEISEDWRKAIQTGARDGQIHVSTLCGLINHAPQSAIDLLDMLTVDPKVENKQHNPLPVRANIPFDQEACRLSCAYVDAKQWTWNRQAKSTLPWQANLAPQDPLRSQEVKVKMLQLPGIMNCSLVHSLAVSKDQRIFTKLVVHALLKHLWRSFRPMFLVDLGHQFLATVVISYWILVAGQVDTPATVRCGLWGLLAAEGMAECIMYVWTCINCYHSLGRRLLIKWMKRASYRAVIGVCALALAVETREDFQPSQNSSILLSINSLLHWITMLFEIRAFRSTGRRILPIMKSVLPIVGMLVIMLFISLAFMHAFWAMDRSGINSISMFNIVVLLFTGEQFLSPEDLLGMEEGMMNAMIILSIGGVFIFLTCTINVFIAVLSDCYDQEQERMVCTFLKERARICSGYFLRPKFKSSGFVHIRQGILTMSWWRWCLLTALIVGLYIALVYVIAETRYLTIWLSAIYPASAVLCIQAILRDVASVGWKQNYLWFCTETGVEEEMFLAPEQRDEEENNGRITRMKKYIREMMKDYDLRMIKALSGSVERWTQLTAQGIAQQHLTLEDVQEKVGVLLTGGQPPAEKIPLPRFKRGLKEKILFDALEGSENSFGLSVDKLMTPPKSRAFGHPPPPAKTMCCENCVNCHACKPRELQDLKEEVSGMKDSLEELSQNVEEQKEVQEQLQKSCQEIQQLLQKVVDMAEKRHRKPSPGVLPKVFPGKHSPPGLRAAVDPPQIPELRLDEALGQGRGNSVFVDGG